ncbi:MAG TPA: PQQ-dependent sugar dehydrogenase [Trueperaceae bacterium]|nr:PQQ-dependent sugar dehydrogenase [Trueperaceae bacterium]
MAGERRPPRSLALPVLSALVAFALVLTASPAAAQVASRRDPLDQVGTAQGYALEVHASGLTLPTALAFIPDAANDPEAPFYFVAELQGGINVVTRSGEVHRFATVPTYGAQDEELEGASQQGLAGLCLAPEHGYLFATYTEPDAGGIIRNRLVRFSARPYTYGLEAAEAVELLPLLAEFQSAPAHQVGDCVVVEDRLYVGVGDGGAPSTAARPDVLLGKVLCLDLDGRPCPEPPFGDQGAAAYVFAKGFRNPFALAYDGGRLVVAENGVDLDRFLPVTRGLDHLWAGTDDALASHAELVFPEPFSPVQLAWVEPRAPYMEPGWAGHYVAAGFGSENVPAGVAYFGGAASSGMAATPPRYLVQWLGPPGEQHFAGAAVGPDGLYVTPMLPLGDLGGVVLRVYFDEQRAHTAAAKPTWGLTRRAQLAVLEELGCTGCHEVAGVGGGVGPPLDQFGFNYRITEYLNSRPYEEGLRAMMADPQDPYAHMNRARSQVLSATGRQRTWVWLQHMLLEPRFDDPDRQMPNLGLTLEEARAARAELFTVLRVNVRGGRLMESAWELLLANWLELSVGALVGAAAVLAVLAATGRRRAPRGGPPEGTALARPARAAPRARQDLRQRGADDGA